MAPATRTANNNQFIVHRHLGQALYGDVWLCEDERHDHTLVAIKQVSLQCAKRALTHNRHLDNPFEERRVAAYLTHIRPQGHTNILQFRQEFLEKGAWYMVTEYCEGGDLMRRLEVAPQNRLQESVALHFFRQIANGVRFLHDNGVAHRDLSLENVLLKNGVCKICDFGLAVIVGSTQTNNNNNNPAETNIDINSSNQLVCSERVGKAYYMAPEVVAEEAYDPMAADVWSLGIMLFIMLTGSPLVSSACRDEKAFLALEAFGVEKILEVWGLRSSVSSGVCGLLSRML